MDEYSRMNIGYMASFLLVPNNPKGPVTPYSATETVPPGPEGSWFESDVS